MKKIIVMVYLLVFTSLAFGETFSGRVAYVLSGDTIHVIANGMKHKVKLFGIDAPEDTQSYFSQAKSTASKKVERKNVRVEVQSVDEDGFKLGKVYYDGDKYLNEELVKEGAAWWYESHAKKEDVLKDAEVHARIERVGLWDSRNIIAPWDWRKGVRESTVIDVPAKKSLEMVYIYKGEYHKLGCKHLKGVEKVLPINEAIKQGYKACKKYD